MKTIEQLRNESGKFWPEDEPLDFRDKTEGTAYYDDDLSKVADANNAWISRIQSNFPELLGVISSNSKPKLMDRLNKLKR